MRRIAIFVILILAYLYYRSVGDAQLAAIGLLSFAAVAQLAPAFFGGLFWRQATARGAIAGMVVGILVWAYTLLLPNIADAGIVGPAILTDGPFGLSLLRPQALFGLDLPPLAHGVFWSLALNIIAYIGFSLGRAPAAIERMQADLFVPTSLARSPSFRLWRSSVTVDELNTTVARYIGEERTRKSFESFARRTASASRRMRKPISSCCGTRSICWPRRSALRHRGSCCRCFCASARSRPRPRSNCSTTPMRRSITTAKSCRPRSSMSAKAIAVFDKDMQLVCWNRQFGEILGLPQEMIGIGARLDEILRFHAVNGIYGPGDIDDLVKDRLTRYAAAAEPFLERFSERGLVVEVRANRMPEGGIVTTFTDITPSFEAAEALERDEVTRCGPRS